MLLFSSLVLSSCESARPRMVILRPLLSTLSVLAKPPTIRPSKPHLLSLPAIVSLYISINLGIYTSLL